MRRVVVTGIGLSSPLSMFTERSWSKIMAGESGVDLVSDVDLEGIPCKIGAQLPLNEDGFDIANWVSAKDRRKMDDFILYGMIAAQQAISDSGWIPNDDESLERTGVNIGSGVGGLEVTKKCSIAIANEGFKKVSPFFVPATLINMLAGHVSVKYGFRGPVQSVVTACATGAHAIGDASCIIRRGDADVMIAGGSEKGVTQVAIAGFARMGALSTNFNDRPKLASRPWDIDRDGFVVGDGAGIVVLEEYQHALRRSAKIYGEVLGYGLSGDAYHITSPHPQGRGAVSAMRMALKNAKQESVDYVNAHGTSTPAGDDVELRAVEEVFDGDVTISSTKSCTGHLLGAAGGAEAIICLLAMRDNVVPPTINLDNPIEHSKRLNLVPNYAQEKKLNITMSNSFGFGGVNASLVFGKV